MRIDSVIHVAQSGKKKNPGNNDEYLVIARKFLGIACFQSRMDPSPCRGGDRCQNSTLNLLFSRATLLETTTLRNVRWNRRAQDERDEASGGGT